MVEALKQAVQKARAMRARADAAHPHVPAQAAAPEFFDNAAPPAGPAMTAQVGAAQVGTTQVVAAPDGHDREAEVEAAWEKLEQIRLSSSHLEQQRLIAHARDDPAHAAFDVLRTKLLGVFAKKGWTRLGICSPGKGCGKTFVAANLALSLSRQADCRTLLVDMDLRSPGLTRTLGVAEAVPIAWLLNGEVDPQDFLMRQGSNLALALNSEKVRDAAETVLAASTARALAETQDLLKPDVVIYDLPPMLVCDDVMGFLPHLDCVLLIVGGGKSRAADVTECERMLADQTPILGVLLNQAEGVSSTQYGYGYGDD